MFRKMLKRIIPKPRMTSIKFTGHFVVKQPGRLDVITKLNHIVNAGLLGIISMIGDTHYDASQYQTTVGPSYGFVTGFGSDTTTGTTATRTSLATIVSYKPDSLAVVGVTKEADGQYRCVWRAIWNAEHFTANKNLGEIGLHLNANKPALETGTPTKASANWIATIFDGSLTSRVCVADGDFTLYTVDYTKPLTIEYWIRMTMA